MACYNLSSALAFALTIGGFLLIKRSPIRLPPWFPLFGTVTNPDGSRTPAGIIDLRLVGLLGGVKSDASLVHHSGKPYPLLETDLIGDVQPTVMGYHSSLSIQSRLNRSALWKAFAMKKHRDTLVSAADVGRMRKQREHGILPRTLNGVHAEIACGLMAIVLGMRDHASNGKTGIPLPWALTFLAEKLSENGTGRPTHKQGSLDAMKRSKEIRTVQYGKDTSISSVIIAVDDHPRVGPHHHIKGKTCPILESRKSEHAYCPAQESDDRSVCRALNTMANHGYVIISRNGCDLSFYDIHSGRTACYGHSSILASVLVIRELLIKRSPIRLPPWFPCYCLSSTLAFVLTIGGFLLIRQSPICFTSRFPFGTVGRPTVNRSKPGRSRGEISSVWRLLLPRDWGGSTNFWSRVGTPRPNDPPETFKFGRPAAYRCNRKSGRRVDPIWFLHHLDWGSSVRWATYRRTRRLSKRRSEDFYDWINSLGNSWSSSPPGAFQNSSDFQINGSTLVSCERHYTTTNNYNHPMGPGNGGVSPEELLARNQQILELQHMIIQLQENDLNMKVCRMLCGFLMN
ncbi:hypothetical protein K435DRAFT_53071 [Dendrothele bispora CBS 962.96]|uniref:Heme haloperoxidase family profile domain-containing protein n=1 Tax=Dendrothele bispora (strain CBS 962.96) TaxID=1314807 RepID=A0A4S8KSB5_DENBC|nr:hypothetical protein K435DRAFT_53071 [Dendrothele bispora CBS 962.96]